MSKNSKFIICLCISFEEYFFYYLDIRVPNCNGNAESPREVIPLIQKTRPNETYSAGEGIHYIYVLDEFYLFTAISHLNDVDPLCITTLSQSVVTKRN